VCTENGCCRRPADTFCTPAWCAPQHNADGACAAADERLQVSVLSPRLRTRGIGEQQLTGRVADSVTPYLHWLKAGSLRGVAQATRALTARVESNRLLAWEAG
jgi:hypothetical protein